MKRLLRVAVVLIFIGLVGIQFFRIDRTNPSFDKTKTLEATFDVPDDVAKILKRSCYDCHSNESVYPWYSNIAPLSWGIAQDIELGRAEYNFSEFGTYTESRQRHKLEEICEEIEEDEMPVYKYRLFHWDAALSDDEIKLVCAWTELERSKIPKSS